MESIIHEETSKDLGNSKTKIFTIITKPLKSFYHTLLTNDRSMPLHDAGEVMQEFRKKKNSKFGKRKVTIMSTDNDSGGSDFWVIIQQKTIVMAQEAITVVECDTW